MNSNTINKKEDPAIEKREDPIIPALLLEVAFWVMAFFAFVGVQSLNGMSVRDCSRYALLNVIILYCVYKLFYLLSGRVWISYLLSGIIWFALGMVNHYVGEFRGVMFLPWDIMAIRTAAHVADTYEYNIYPQEILWILFIGVTAFYAGRLRAPLFKGMSRLVYTVVSLAVCAGLMYGMINSDRYREIPDRLYLIERYYRTQGITLSFFNYSKFLFNTPPEGYSLEECERIINEYGALPDEDTLQVRAQNIIVVMNEAFADFYTLGSLPEAEEALTFFGSISENAITGNLYVPVYGGTTVNTEYEFLTGNSIAYQKGCPLSYAVRDDRPSIAAYLKNKGYETIGFHPAAAVNWNRGRAYPLLGFDRFYSIEDYEDEEVPLVNEHPTDEWDFEKLISLYENRKSDRFFIFNVTMQNHSAYEFEFPEGFGEKVPDLSDRGDFPQGEKYLALLQKSDEAFKELIDYFAAVKEPTVVVMFGDHQPKLEEDFPDMVYNSSHDDTFDENDAADNIRKYCTPFVIWANYDIPEQHIEMMSSNYLQGLVLETAGIEGTPYLRLLKELRRRYPVLSVNGVMDAAGNLYATDEVDGDELVRYYRYLEYNNINEDQDRLLWDGFE